MNEKALEKWTTSWGPDTHTTEHANKRITSAKSAKLTPIKIDSEDFFGYFKGSHGRYETWLDSCNCVDFIRFKLPCKHIYRLAIELGVLNEKADTDIKMIPQTKDEKTGLSETIDIVEMLSQDAQKELCKIAYNTTDKEPIVTVKADAIIEELLRSGILAEDGSGIQEKITFGKKDELIKFLTAHDIKFSKSARKQVLEDICLSNIPEQTKKHFGVIYIYKVFIPNRFSRRNIHYYLHRKYDYFEYFDDDFKLIPLLETSLPEDKVTDELIKRGFYSRDRHHNSICISIDGSKSK